MARILEEEIERIKREVSLVRLVEARGVKLTRRGHDLVGLCPWHEDHSPSLVITPEKNLWHCFGACNAGGSTIDWVMRDQNATFRRAVDLLRNRAGLPGYENDFHHAEPAPINAQPTTQNSPPDLSVEDRVLLLRVVAHYHQTLKSHPNAQAYLKKRGLDSAEMIEHFQMGFSNSTLKDCLPAEEKARLLRIGVVRFSGHEHFAASIVIPIFDEQGGVAGMYGRKISKPKAGYPKHLYLPGPHKGVWNIAALAASKEIILCEALMDALTFWCAGYRNVIASYGAKGFTEDHFSAFERYGTKRALIAYDRDNAGEEGAASLAEQLMGCGIECLRIQFPKGMDANEYALKVQPADKSLGLLIGSAVWLGKGSVTTGVRPLRPAVALATAVGTPTADMPLPLVVENQTPPAVSQPATPAGDLLPPADIATEVTAAEVVIPIGDRRYRIRGLSKNMSYEQLKVNLLVARGGTPPAGEGFYVDTLDLYSARARAAYIKEAARELNMEEPTIKKDVGHVLLKLEALQDQQIKQALAPKNKAVILSEAETGAAMELLRDPKLLDRILFDFESCGVVGEETNKLVGYLAATSRLLDKPLAILIQSASSAGKSSLMEAVLSFVPAEEQVKYSAMTGQSLFYMEGVNLKHKILAIAEEEGVQRASYALKMLQSEGELAIASTGKDPNTGRLVTHEYRMEGPVMVFSTTAADEIDAELLNRCIILTANEDREQTRAIHRIQREQRTLEGLWSRRERDRLIHLYQNAQRLLRPIAVVNPYAKQLTFLDDQTRTRRDHDKYLTLIETIALLHQHQREIKSDYRDGRDQSYMEVTVEDIAVANRLANEVLGRSLDELPPQTRRLLIRIDQMVTEACVKLSIDRSEYRFSRKAVRQYTGWSNTAVRIHIERLIELEYLLVHRGSRGQSFVYELLYDGQGQDGKPFLMGLIEVEGLEQRELLPHVEASLQESDRKLAWVNGQLAGSKHGQNRVKTGGFQGRVSGIPSNNGAAFLHSSDESAEKTHIRGRENGGAGPICGAKKEAM